jgi:hypothetical protein
MSISFSFSYHFHLLMSISFSFAHVNQHPQNPNQLTYLQSRSTQSEVEVDSLTRQGEDPSGPGEDSSKRRSISAGQMVALSAPEQSRCTWIRAQQRPKRKKRKIYIYCSNLFGMRGFGKKRTSIKSWQSIFGVVNILLIA